MTLFVSDTPVTWLKSGHGGNGWTDEVIKKLEDLYFEKKVISIVTSSKTYKNMAIESITFSKSTEIGYARQIPITFKEIRTTSTKKTTIPASYGKSGESGASAGTASTTSSSTPPSSSSSSNGGTSSANTSGNNGSILYNLAGNAGLLP